VREAGSIAGAQVEHPPRESAQELATVGAMLGWLVLSQLDQQPSEDRISNASLAALSSHRRHASH
jgi:hypothetical protein